MLRYIPSNIEKTLKFGCGNGNFSSLIKEKYSSETWAVEIDKKAADTTAAKLDKIICDDAQDALGRLPNGYFDCVFFFDILEHLVNPYVMLEDIKSKLTIDGIVIASIPNMRYYRVFSDYVFKGNWDYKEHGVIDKTHLRFFTYKSIRKLFKNAGFELLTIEGIHSISSRTYRVLNLLLLNSLWDVQFKHFVVVAKPA